MATTVPLRALALVTAVLTSAPIALSQLAFDAPLLVPAGPQPRRVKVGDLNQDGFLDAVLGHDGTNLVYVFHGDGTGALSLFGTYDAGIPDTWDIELGDIDNDVYPDLVVGNINAARVLRDDGAGGFGPWTHITNHEGIWDIELEDLNLDGETDMVHSTDIFSIAHVSWGTPTHIDGASGPGLPIPAGLPEVAIGDLDGEGTPDVTLTTGVGVYVYLNLMWSPPTIFNTPVWTGSTIADVDLDTHLDVVAVGGTTLHVLGGDGNGGFPSTIQRQTVSGAMDVEVADMNADGLADVVVLGSGLLGIHLAPNLDLAASIATCATTLTNFEVGNFNGDELLDLAVACRTGGFEVHLNRSYPPIGTSYCSANLNSSGNAGMVSVSGSRFVHANDFELQASGLPPGKFGYFVMADSQAFIPLFGGSSGNLCLGLPFVRFAGDILLADPMGMMAFRPDLTALPQMTVFHPGHTWNFQAWFRDDPAPTNSNTTDAVAVTFRTDGDPAVQFPVAITRIAEQTTQFEIPITVSQPVDSDVLVSYAHAGSATNNVDYRIESTNPLIIPAGNASAALLFTLADDQDIEGDETVTIAITGVAGGVQGTAPLHTVVIVDDD